MNENIKRARDTYIHDMEQIEKIDDRSIQNEVDIVYLSSGLEKLTVTSTETKELAKTTSKTAALLARNIEGLHRRIEEDKDEIKDIIETRCRGSGLNGPLTTSWKFRHSRPQPIENP